MDSLFDHHSILCSSFLGKILDDKEHNLHHLLPPSHTPKYNFRQSRMFDLRKMGQNKHRPQLRFVINVLKNKKNYPAHSCRIFPDFSQLGLRLCWLSIRWYSARFRRIIANFCDLPLACFIKVTLYWTSNTSSSASSQVCVLQTRFLYH